MSGTEKNSSNEDRLSIIKKKFGLLSDSFKTSTTFEDSELTKANIEEIALEKALEIIKKQVPEMIEKQISIVGENLNKTKKEFDDKIESSKLKTIETLGIFVALFTFISIDFQVFRSYQHPSAIVGLTLILLGSLLTFVIIMDFILNINLPFIKKQKILGSIETVSQMMKKTMGYEEEVDFKWSKSDTWGVGVKVRFIPLVLFCSITITIGILLFTLSPKESVESQNTARNNEVKDVQINLKNLEEKYYLQDKVFGSSINELSNNINLIRNCVQNFGFTSRCFK